ncbi:MAG: hypothetical protein ACJ75B_18040 [Flavisolibacter sp.]
MPQTTARKLKIRERDQLRTLHAPADFKKKVGPLPEGVKISDKVTTFQQLHWFVRDRAQMEEELEQVMELTKGEVICWIYYPKGSSGIQTDLTRDKGWDAVLKEDMQWLSLISFDDTWSAFAMRRKKRKVGS